MKITELELVMKNKDKLDSDDIDILNTYNIFDQYKTGELDLPVTQMLNLMELLSYLCDKHKLK